MPETPRVSYTVSCGLQIHWFSIVNSCVTVLLLTGFLATILMRVLKADFIKYTRDDEAGTASSSYSPRPLQQNQPFDSFQCPPQGLEFFPRKDSTEMQWLSFLLERHALVSAVHSTRKD